MPKDARRIDCYGTVDELNAWIGVARETAAPNEPVSEEEIARRQTLLRLVASEASGDLDQAAATLGEAMALYPHATAFRIAEAYLKAKAADAEGKASAV